MTAPLVEVEGLHRRFEPDVLRRLFRGRREPVKVLRGLDLTLEAGEWLAVMGTNGAGKTTLLKIIAGLLLPSAGTARVDGHDVARDTGVVRATVGYALADERSFHWRLTPRQNLQFFATLERLGRRDARERVTALLDRLDLGADGDRPFFELSAGMRQRLAIARALLKRPRVLLLDEPTRSIDAGHAAEMWPLVRSELEESGGGAILVTHSAQDAVAQGSRVASLEDGRLREWSARELSPVRNGYARLSLKVQHLRPEVVEALRALPGVSSLSLQEAGEAEHAIEVAAEEGLLDLARFIGLLSRSGASVCSLQRTSGIEAEGAPAGGPGVAATAARSAGR
jgi:ABC-2 type transport system ATP-binding protein